MGQAEFDLLLDAVRTAMEPDPQDDFVAHPSTYNRQPQAANDNGLAWPLIPFPEGWHASC